MFSQFWPLKELSADTKVASQISFSDGPTKALRCELCGEAFLSLAEQSHHLEVMHPADPDEDVLLEDCWSYREVVEAVSGHNQRSASSDKMMGRCDVEPKKSTSTSPLPSADYRTLNPHHALESFSSDIFLDDDIDSSPPELLRGLESRSITVCVPTDTGGQRYLFRSGNGREKVHRDRESTGSTSC